MHKPRAGSHAIRRAASPSGAVDWPSLGGDPQHSGYRSDPGLSTANASTLGLNWMTRIYYADIGSPVVAYNPALGAEAVYVGDENGDVFAINEATGAQLWSKNIAPGDALRSSPLYVAADNSLWVDTIYDQTIRKLDAATGNQLCSYKTIYDTLSSPISVTLPNGSQAIFIGVQDGVKNGPEISLNEANCTLNFGFTDYRFQPAGSFDTPAYTLSASGEPIFFFGTADPDSSFYAVDASAGNLLWDVDTYNPPNEKGTYDIASAPSVTAPGVNGFADGAAYIGNKYGYEYGLDLATGAQLWRYDVFGGKNVTRDQIAGMAIDGSTIVGGFLNGVYSINAVTGAKIWTLTTTAEVESTPNIIGPAGQEVTSFADLSGKLYVLNLATAQQLYSYQTGGYITASPAETNGHIIDVSSDGFLYDFAPGGSNIAPPSTTIASPANGTVLANPNGTLTVQGSAADAASVGAVEIGIQSGGRAGPWWNAANAQWQSGPVSNPASLGSPGAATTTWSIAFPVPAAGGPFEVFASAVNSGNQADRSDTLSNFSIHPSGTAPSLSATTLYVPPGGTTFASGSGFAAKEKIVVTLNGLTIGNATSGAGGAFVSTKALVPVTARLGPTTLTATGQTSGLSAITAFTVGNSWTQSGGTAGHTSYEPNDNLLANVVHIGPGIFIEQAYYYNDTAPVNSSPAVVNGTAYFGNDTGVMTAIAVTTGAPIWTYQTNSSDPIDTAPAVALGTLYFGATDGNAYALNAASGAPVSTLAIGGNVSSPAVAGGYVAFTSDNGSIVVISQATGQVVESLNLGVAIHSSPVIVPAIGAVVVGDDSGNVTAISLTTGAPIWQVPTGGAVDAPAAFSNGTVYVGSTSGTFYAITAKTGAIAWTYAAAAPIRTGALLGFLPGSDSSGSAADAFGDDNGDIYGLSTKGALLWHQKLSASVAGIGAANDAIMVNTVDGVVWALRPLENGLILMHDHTGAALSTVPVVNNGAVYVGSEAGGLFAFTPYGYAPFSRKKAQSTPAIAMREYPIHFDLPQQARMFRPARSKFVRRGAPPVSQTRTYAIFWTAEANATRNVRDMLTASRPTGSSIDRTPYPRVLSDGAVQEAVLRAITVNHWRAGTDARFLVFTAFGAPLWRAGACSYHSAFDVGGNRAFPAIYAAIPGTAVTSGCGSAISNAIREQSEMSTDPLLPAWLEQSGARRAN